MNEARRFFRHVIPGLFFCMMVGGSLLTSNAELRDYLFKSKAEKRSIDESKADKDSTPLNVFSAIFTVFVASGALGYLFSVIHHLCWHSRSKPGGIGGLRKSLEWGKDNNLLTLVPGEAKKGSFGESIEVSSLSNADIWAVGNLVWFTYGSVQQTGYKQPLTEYPSFKFIEEKSITIWDSMHAAGSLLVAAYSAFAVLMFVIPWCKACSVDRIDVFLFFAFLVLLCILRCNYLQVSSIVDSVASGNMNNLFDRISKPIRMRFYRSNTNLALDFAVNGST